MSKVNDYGFTEDVSGISNGSIMDSTPFLQSDAPIISSGKIGTGNKNGGIGSGGGSSVIDINNVDLNDNGVNNGSGSGNISGYNKTIQFFKGLTHPLTCTVHVLFKVTPILLYLFSNSLGFGFIMAFIVNILLLSFDFWMVKNVSGRLLVGLRWWSVVSDIDGNDRWHFESAEGRKNNPIESIIFWSSLYVAPLFWILFFLKCIISLQFIWILIPIVAISLAFANIVGFYKCSNSNVSNAAASFASNIIGRSLIQRATSFM